MPAATPPWCRRPCSISCSTPGWIGSCHYGAVSSAIFSAGSCPPQRTYGAALRRFHAFCTQFAVHSPFPVSEQLLCCFAAYLADQGLAPQTGKSYLSAIRCMQISLGLPDPRDQSSLPVLKRVQAGISRARLAHGAAVHSSHLFFPYHLNEPIAFSYRVRYN